MRKLFLAAAAVALSAGVAAAQTPAVPKKADAKLPAAAPCPTGGCAVVVTRSRGFAATTAFGASFARPVLFPGHAVVHATFGLAHRVAHPFGGRFARRGGCAGCGCGCN